MIKRVYIDTSVYGGYFDKEFEKATIPFFNKIIEEKVKIITSDILELEIYQAPSFISDFFESIPSQLIERVELSNEAKNLALKYIEEKVVGKTSLTDCQHISLATIYRVDALISWNFKHIVNIIKIRGYNAINFREGYQMTEIRTPKEIFSYENGK